MQSNPYLNFKGQCEEAFKFYEKCFNGKIESMFMYDGAPTASATPAGWGKKVMHSAVRIGDTFIMGADAQPDHYQQPPGFSISVTVDGIAEAERIFNGLSQSGTIQMPLQKTFWAARFGMLTDRFGIPWMINCHEAQ